MPKVRKKWVELREASLKFEAQKTILPKNGRSSSNSALELRKTEEIE